jgi:hypothetical protein
LCNIIILTNYDRWKLVVVGCSICKLWLEENVRCKKKINIHVFINSLGLRLVEGVEVVEEV